MEGHQRFANTPAGCVNEFCKKETSRRVAPGGFSKLEQSEIFYIPLKSTIIVFLYLPGSDFCAVSADFLSGNGPTMAL